MILHVMALALLGATMADPPYSSCEMRDGDCPNPCPKGQGSLDLTPSIRINSMCAEGLCQGNFSSAAATADGVIRAHAAPGGSDIIRFDDVKPGLHTSVLYTCCHTVVQQGLLVAVLSKLRWRSFDVSYDDAGCNIDTHVADKVYIHGMPDAAGQAALHNFTNLIQAAMMEAKIPVHHPRRTLFHMTLARVTREYATDAAVKALKDLMIPLVPKVTTGPSKPFFGLLRVCKFQVMGIDFVADDGCQPF